MSIYTRHFSTKATPQTEPIPGSLQVPNSAGGFSFAVDDWARLERFLILGTEGGSFYADERKMTKDNAESVLRCIKADGPRVVTKLVEVSVAGQAPKNDPAIFALAMCMKLGDDATRRLAGHAVPSVCRIGTHIFQLADAIEAFGGWGRITKRAFSDWYNQRALDKVVLDVLKYRQRNGRSHKDLLRQSHAGKGAVGNEERRALFQWVARDGELGERSFTRKVEKEARTYIAPTAPKHRMIDGFEKLQSATTGKEAAALISEYGLPRECVPTTLLGDVAVWDALLNAGKGMPMTAMIRNLGKMTSIGLLKPLSKASGFVVERLMDRDHLRRARVHPMQVLIAQKVYAQGHGDKGSLSWSPDPRITDALDEAFYASFEFVAPTNKRFLLGLDVSGSMSGGSVAGSSLTPRDASGAMAMVAMRTEPVCYAHGFSDTFIELGISKKMRLDDVIRKISNLPFAGTDCALPMEFARKKKIEVDAFVVYTDSETWSGGIHPAQALRKYRDEMGIPAKLIVCAMVSNGFTIADPNDAGMLDVVGFSTATPSVMSAFIGGAAPPKVSEED